MTEPVYNLLFRGEVLEGQDRSAVARRLMVLLKIDAPKVKAMFSGRPVVLRRHVSKDVAARFQAAFREAGARLRVAPAEAAAPASAATASEATASEAPATGAPATKTTLAQRLAAQEAASSDAADDGRPGALEPVADLSAVSGRPAQQAVAVDLPGGGGWTLVPEGRDLVAEDELPRSRPVVVDVSHLSAAPANSGSLEDVLPPAVPPIVPDTSGLELDAPGTDLAPVREVADLELDLSGLTLAAVGADLAEEVEAGLPLAIPDPDFGLAPPGAEIETLPRKPPPPPPDTSHLDVE